ncbi:type II secretion system F family protein [Marinobacter sp. HL-58]|uniref:type II secretion system F family protein n=1 Tax=Marinobacter sp. HL-58 TaxID=1479237 RepID=UPI00068ABC87|nr:type II secretion system F family protein [Marinobacter sp. HL-58]KPP97806.1 MAG: Tad secretion system assembly platform protein TadC [Marinobacter sp. HL-58]
MIELIFGAALVIGLLSLIAGIYGAPSWSMQARINARLHHQRLVDDDPESDSAMAELVFWLAERRLVRGDFKELEPALEASGRSPYQSRVYYFGLCWVVPAIILPVAFVFFSAAAAILTALMAFFVPRRMIRASGAFAEKQQNREAIELCHMTRMLLEAGLSPERSLKLISHQARDLMPRLIHRVDRFNRVMESGADRTVALDELGRNRNITVLRSYVTLMKQSGTLGSRVSVSLDQIIEEAQHEERSKLKEETNRVGAKMTIIMMAFMLPALFMLIGGPAVLSILDTLRN